VLVQVRQQLVRRRAVRQQEGKRTSGRASGRTVSHLSGHRFGLDGALDARFYCDRSAAANCRLGRPAAGSGQ
jgi:hypothetical protein